MAEVDHTIKYGIGSKVVHRQDSEVCEVLKIQADERGITYTISSVEFNAAEKKVINGVKTVHQDELTDYVEPEATNE